MTRKIALSIVALLALTIGAFAASGGSAIASASSYRPTATPAGPTPTPPFCAVVGYNNCVAYPDFKKPTPTVTATPRPSATPDLAAIAAAAAADADNNTATSGNGGNSIAFTGAESRVLGLVGAGLIGFGAIAVAVSRRVSDEE